MRAYELMIIVDGDADEATVNSVVDNVGQLVDKAGGTVASTDDWGKREFAYKINHKTAGFYLVFEIVTDTGDLGEVERFLRLADEVVRHKVMRLPDKEAHKRGLFSQANEKAEPA